MKDMVVKNMIIRKVYLLLGIIILVNINMLASDDTKTNSTQKSIRRNYLLKKKISSPESKDENINNQILNEEKKEEIIQEEPKVEEKKEEIIQEEPKVEIIQEDPKTGEKIEGPKIEENKKTKVEILEPEKEEKKEEKKEEQRKHIRMLKTLRWCGFVAKPLGSLVWSYANSIYHFEKIELDKVYFFKYILCVGYRWQAGFMKKSGLFFDVNISAVSVIHSILCTYIQYQIDYSSHKNEVHTWKWFLGKFIFYTIPNSLNFNLNIKIKDSYFAINLAGIMAEIISRIFSQNAGLNVETIKKEINKKA